MINATFDVDRDSRSLTVSVELPTDVETAWSLWTDPRKLEKWWGPPGFPCTVARFDLHPGGVITYFMTGPDDQRYHGWWRVGTVARPTTLTLVDGFGESPDAAASGMPESQTEITFAPSAQGVTMTIHSRYETTESLDQALELGMEEGFLAALSQIEVLL